MQLVEQWLELSIKGHWWDIFCPLDPGAFDTVQMFSAWLKFCLAKINEVKCFKDSYLPDY